MTHKEDLLRFKDDRISALEKRIIELEHEVEFVKAQLEVSKQVNFNH
jgi:hypothetical protein